jgi:predicted RNA-binding protein with TRAM domain
MRHGQNKGGFSKPLEIDNAYVDVSDTGRDGEGVTRIGGLVIFVKMRADDKDLKIGFNSGKDNFAIV